MIGLTVFVMAVFEIRKWWMTEGICMQNQISLLMHFYMYFGLLGSSRWQILIFIFIFLEETMDEEISREIDALLINIQDSLCFIIK